MNENMRIVLQLLLNYSDEGLINDEFVFLSHVDTPTLRSVAGIIDVIREGVQEHIDYRRDMDSFADFVTHHNPKTSVPAVGKLVPSNDIMHAMESFDEDA
jgi:hypothetical protein